MRDRDFNARNYKTLASIAIAKSCNEIVMHFSLSFVLFVRLSSIIRTQQSNIVT